MQANPEKFQVIAVGKKSAQKSPSFKIGKKKSSHDGSLGHTFLNICPAANSTTYFYLLFSTRQI
jgi:hypothetical protein